MILAITIHEMQRLNIACKRVLGEEEWAPRFTVAWESLHGQGLVTADMLVSAIMDGVKIATGIRFDSEEAAALLALADYMGSGFVGEHTKTVAMIRRKVGR